MYTCVICHFPVEEDDIEIRAATRCVCVRCYHRETDSELHLPKELRRELEEIVVREAPKK